MSRTYDIFSPTDELRVLLYLELTLSLSLFGSMENRLRTCVDVGRRADELVSLLTFAATSENTDLYSTLYAASTCWGPQSGIDSCTLG